MHITRQGSEGLKHTYLVIIEAADIASALEAELKQLGKKVRIPGFRPGFVPLNVLKQRYGAAVRDDVLKNVITDATSKVLKEGNLRPASQPDVQVEQYIEGSELRFTLTVEAIPDVPAIDYKKISLERETFEVPDSEIDQAMERLAKENPKPKDLPESHKAKNGEVVTMDFEGSIGGVPFPGGKAEDFAIELGSGKLIDTFEKQLEGAKAGDEKEVRVTFPADYFSQELAGKEALFKVKVKKVSQLEYAPVDDEFAKSRGFADLAGLRAAARDQIIRHYNQITRARLKKRLFDELETRADYLLPAKMVEQEFEGIWNQLQSSRGGASDEELYEGRSEKDVRDEYRKIAERRVRLGILLADIGTKQKIEATREEVTQALMAQASRFPGQEQMVYDFYRKNPARLDDLRGPILEEKAVDWIISQLALTDKKVETSVLTEDALLGDIEGEPAAPRAKKAAAKKKPAKKASEE